MGSSFSHWKPGSEALRERERKETTAMAEEDAAAATGVVVAMANNNNRTKDHLRNSVVDFLLHENYLLTAFELLHELQEDGLVEVEAATKLQLFFANSQMFPPDELAKMQALHGIDAQQLADERESAAEKAAVFEYELRLAREDIKSLQDKLERQSTIVASMPDDGVATVPGDIEHSSARNGNHKDLGSLGEKERINVNCAVQQYLMTAGYKITAMTFQEEVDQDLDKWQNSTAYVLDALRHYYRSFLASANDHTQDMETLQQEKDILLKEKEACEIQKASLVKLLEGSRKDTKEREKQVQQLKEFLDQATRELNEYRMEVTSLKLELESVRASLAPVATRKQEPAGTDAQDTILETVSEPELGVGVPESSASNGRNNDAGSAELIGTNEEASIVEEILLDLIESSTGVVVSNGTKTPKEEDVEIVGVKETILQTVDDINTQEGLKEHQERHGLEVETVQILADALPKIVPYVLINHREELLPLIMCAIERHPDSSVRDSLTHLLFNLIKRPDELQRRIIMDACVELSRSVGQMRTETELLPQCWEQIDHKYEERRLLVAQSCGELGQLVGSEMRTSLILSILQQLVDDPTPVVREAAAHNLALLLPLFSNMDKYSKVEGLMFDLVCDPMGVVVDTCLNELVPALVMWNKHEKQPLTQLYQGVLSRLLSSAQRCPPLSGVEGTAEAHLRSLGEQERWNIDVLLRMLSQLLPEVRNYAFETCPYPDKVVDTDLGTDASFFTEDIINCYCGSDVDWPALDWLMQDCFPTLLQLVRMLAPREESLRTRLCKLLLSISECFGSSYLMLIMLPLFLSATGDDTDLPHLSSKLSVPIRGFLPRSPTEERLAVMCVLPVLLAGVLGAPNMKEGKLAQYLRELILQSSLKDGAWTSARAPELIDAVRFLCTFERQHGVIVGVLWELVVNSNADVKITAAVLSKALVGNVELKFATQQVLPALVTLGSDPNLDVKHASIDAFGAVAQHFKDEEVVDKVKMQMDSFLEDGSHEATIAVVRALSVAIPLTTPSLRDYLLQKLVILSGAPMPSAKLARRREKVDVICEAVRALDATDLSQTSVSNLLIPTIQNLLKDVEALDPAHKEALEGILKERGGVRIADAISKAVGTSMGSLFGEGGYLRDTGYLSRTNTGDIPAIEVSTPTVPQPVPPQEEGGLKRMMRLNFLGRT